MKNLNKDQAFSIAKNRVDKLRGFYIHGIVYVVVNFCISAYKINRNLNNGETFDQAFFDTSTYILWMLWGIGLALHAFSVFGLPLLLGKNWEEDKINQYMEEEQSKDWQ